MCTNERCKVHQVYSFFGVELVLCIRHEPLINHHSYCYQLQTITRLETLNPTDTIAALVEIL